MPAGLKLTIDSNKLQSPDLETFLAAKTSNLAVLPDFVWFEIYKQSDLDAIKSALAILTSFPDQVLVLQPGHQIAGLDPRFPDFTDRIQLPDVGKSLRQMQLALMQAETGELAVLSQLAERWAEAAAVGAGMLEGVDDILASLPEMATMYTADELRRIRTKQSYTPDMTAKTFGAAYQIYEVLTEFRGISALNFPAMLDTYLYRFALGILLYLLWWIRNGSQTPKRKERVRNDIIDLGIAVSASYFDGLLTDDLKARWLYDELVSALLSARLAAKP